MFGKMYSTLKVASDFTQRMGISEPHIIKAWCNKDKARITVTDDAFSTIANDILNGKTELPIEYSIKLSMKSVLGTTLLAEIIVNYKDNDLGELTVVIELEDVTTEEFVKEMFS